MILKKHKNGRLCSILSSSNPVLKKSILKHGVDKEFLNPISELYLNLTEGNVQLGEVVKQQTKQHRSIVRALARSNNKGIDSNLEKNSSPSEWLFFKLYCQ